MKATQVVEKRTVEIPDDVTVTVKDKTIIVQGKLGKVEKSFPLVSAQFAVEEEDGKKVFAVWDYFPKRKQKAIVGTIQGHVKNMITGVTKGFTYKLKIVYSHFPMTVTKAKGGIIITGQYGTRAKRFIPLFDGVKVNVKGDDIILEGVDVEAVSQSAARIQESTKLRGKYRKDPRVFQDGIYISEYGANE